MHTLASIFFKDCFGVRAVSFCCVFVSACLPSRRSAKSFGHHHQSAAGPSVVVVSRAVVVVMMVVVLRAVVRAVVVLVMVIMLAIVQLHGDSVGDCAVGGDSNVSAPLHCE